MGNISFIEMFSEYQKMNYNQKTEANKLREQYENDIRPLRNNAMKTCQVWTNTSCKEASEILIMLQKYSKYRYAIKHSSMSIEKIIPIKDQEGYHHLENYRKKGMGFWCDLSRLPFSYHSVSSYPYVGEMMEFSTFHWAIYMTNNKAAEPLDKQGGEPYTYSSILKSIAHIHPNQKVQNTISTFRREIDVQFEQLQKEAKEFTFVQQKSTNRWWF